MDLTHNDMKTLATFIAEAVGEIIAAEKITGRWLSLSEAMEYAKVKSSNTIKKWIDEGYIYGFKRSGEWIIDRDTIDDWYSSERRELT